MLISSSNTDDECTMCKNGLSTIKPVTQTSPQHASSLYVTMCEHFNFSTSSSCSEDFSPKAFGAAWTQVGSYADVQGQDGDYICWSLNKSCRRPNANPLDVNGLFPKPKPENITVPKPSGKRAKVLHLSDFHLDARYAVGSEANCDAGMCCRANQNNSASPDHPIMPAPAYGSFKCDSPYDLALAALQAIGPLTGTGGDKDPLAWTIYTGDLVSHDPGLEQSQAYLEYAETSVYSMMKQYISGPVFPALGNHDSTPASIDSPRTLPADMTNQQSWNYEHISSLWQNQGWISAGDASQARTQYGAYSVKNQFGLRIIAFNAGELGLFYYYVPSQPTNLYRFRLLVHEQLS